MKTKLNTITPVELNGTSYQGVAVKTTVNLLTDALGMKPSVWSKDSCEWYLQHGDYKFSVYCNAPLSGGSVNWFRIGAINKHSAHEAHDIVLHMLKTA